MTNEKAIEILQELWRYKETDKYTEAEIRQALDMAVKSLKAWDDLLQWLDMIKPKTYPRTKGWIDCIKQIYRERMER